MPTIPAPLTAVITGTSTPNEWMEQVSLLMAREWFANTWSVESGSACRVVFAFNNGLRLTWVGDANGDAPEVLQAWLDPAIATNYPAGIHDDEPIDCPAPGEWEWNNITQTWEQTLSPTEAATIITATCDRHGPATVFLPWEFITNDELIESLRMAIPDGQTITDLINNLDQHADVQDMWDEAVENYEEDGAIMAVALVVASTTGLPTPTAWGGQPATVTLGDDYLPPYSPLARFYEFVAAMEEHDDWIVVWDECCGTCAGGTLRSIREYRNLPEGSPSLVLFAQNAQYYWQPNGYMAYEFYQSNDAELAVIMEEAAKVGLRAEKANGDDRIVLTA